MKLIQNAGQDRVIDLLHEQMKPDHQLDCASPALSLFAFSELSKSLAKLKKVQ